MLQFRLGYQSRVTYNLVGRFFNDGLPNSHQKTNRPQREEGAVAA